MSETRETVVAALAANLAVAAAKGVGGALTGSAALLSEAAHSVADTLNEVFLLLSLRKAERPADRTHPFGYGKERFFWSLLAAVGIFVSGAGYSAYEGVKALRGTDEMPSTRDFLVVYAVLVVSLLLEGASLGKALRQVRDEAAVAKRSRSRSSCAAPTRPSRPWRARTPSPSSASWPRWPAPRCTR